jgi:hypothetical protein
VIDPRLILTLAFGLLLLLNGLTSGRPRLTDGEPDADAEQQPPAPPQA